MALSKYTQLTIITKINSRTFQLFQKEALFPLTITLQTPSHPQTVLNNY